MVPPKKELEWIATANPTKAQLEDVVTSLRTAIRNTGAMDATSKEKAEKFRPVVEEFFKEGEEVKASVARAFVKYWVKNTWDKDRWTYPASGEKLTFDVNPKPNRYRNRERVLPHPQGGYLEYQEPGILA